MPITTAVGDGAATVGLGSAEGELPAGAVAVSVGTGVGFGVGLGVGFGVGLGVGFGIGFGVGLGVGFGVAVGGGGVGAETVIGLGLGLSSGRQVGSWPPTNWYGYEPSGSFVVYVKVLPLMRSLSETDEQSGVMSNVPTPVIVTCTAHGLRTSASW